MESSSSPQITLCRLSALNKRVHPELAPMSRALKSHCLAQALGCTAQELSFVEDENGKPQLKNSRGWQFNLSHSGDTAVMAVARQPIGIDVERQQRQANWLGISERIFHDSERRQLQRLPQAQQAARAVQLWTAKEAWAKATGVGIAGMQDAPAMQWQVQAWALPMESKDALLQATVWNDWLVSVCLLAGRLAAPRWQAVQWLGGEQFAATTAPAVTELRA